MKKNKNTSKTKRSMSLFVYFTISMAVALGVTFLLNTLLMSFFVFDKIEPVGVGGSGAPTMPNGSSSTGGAINPGMPMDGVGGPMEDSGGIGGLGGPGGVPVQPFVLVTIACLIIAGLLTFIIARRVLKPISELGNAMKTVAGGDFSPRLQLNNVTKETAELFENFNQMAEDLGKIETLGKDFVANVSHEFKTPVAAIEGYATLLLRDDLTPEERSEYSQFIIGSMKQLSSLTDNILILNRLENDAGVPTKTDFRLDEQIRESILLSEKEWIEKRIAFNIDLDEMTINSNEELLRIVWHNLIQNAIKFTNEGGTISIKCSNVFAYDADTDGANKMNQGVIVSIEDNGIGMNSNMLNHMFERFYQGDKARYTSGNGLGLALVKRICEMLGVSIKVDSMLNLGTKFEIKIP
jgi:signal transduction histidine kinase